MCQSGAIVTSVVTNDSISSFLPTIGAEARPSSPAVKRLRISKSELSDAESSPDGGARCGRAFFLCTRLRRSASRRISSGVIVLHPDCLCWSQRRSYRNLRLIPLLSTYHLLMVGRPAWIARMRVPTECRIVIVVNPLDNDMDANAVWSLTVKLVCFGEKRAMALPKTRFPAVIRHGYDVKIEDRPFHSEQWTAWDLSERSSSRKYSIPVSTDLFLEKRDENRAAI